MGKMYTVTEAAKELGLTPRTVREYIKRGKINAVKYTKVQQGIWSIPESEIKKIKEGL